MIARKVAPGAGLLSLLETSLVVWYIHAMPQNPPLIGFIGEHSSVPRALTAVIVLLGLAALIADVVRPLQVSTS